MRAAADAESGLEELPALLAGDKPAWDAFVARYAGIIYAAVRRRLVPAGCADEADDVAQDVFLRLCRHDYKLLRDFDPARARLTTWLTVIASSAAIDHLRRRRRPARGLDEVPEAELAVDPVEPTRLTIPEGLLSPRQALVLELLYQRDMTPAEVGAALSIDPQTVRSMHHKALTKLRAHVKAGDAG